MTQWPFQAQARWHLHPYVTREEFLSTSADDQRTLTQTFSPIFHIFQILPSLSWPNVDLDYSFKQPLSSLFFDLVLSLSSLTLSLYFSFFFKGFSAHSLAVISVLSSTMSQTCVPCPCKNRHRHQKPNPSSRISRSHSFSRSVPSVLWFLIPKGVSGSADTTGISALPAPSIQHPLPTPSRSALAYLCICRGRKHLHCGNSKTLHYKRDAHLWQ